MFKYIEAQRMIEENCFLIKARLFDKFKSDLLVDSALRNLEYDLNEATKGDPRNHYSDQIKAIDNFCKKYDIYI